MDTSFECKEIIGLLAEYADDELDDTARKTVEEHLKVCEECRKEIEKMKTLSSLLKQSAEEIPFELENIDECEIVAAANYEINCEAAVLYIEEYIDNELENGLTLVLEEHLDNCPECSKHYNQMLKLRNLLLISHLHKMEEAELAVEIPSLGFLDNCEDIKANLHSFADNELAKPDMLKVYAHLLQCESCTTEYNKVKQTKETLQNYFINFGETAEPYVSEKVIVSRVYNSRRNFIYGYSAAVIMLTMLTGYLFNDIKQPDTRTVQATYNHKKELDKLDAGDFVVKTANLEIPEGVVKLIHESYY